MLHLLGATLVPNEQVRIALTKIGGIGPTESTQVRYRLGISDNIKVNESTKYPIRLSLFHNYSSDNSVGITSSFALMKRGEALRKKRFRHRDLNKEIDPGNLSCHFLIIRFEAATEDSFYIIQRCKDLFPVRMMVFARNSQDFGILALATDARLLCMRTTKKRIINQLFVGKESDIVLESYKGRNVWAYNIMGFTEKKPLEPLYHAFGTTYLELSILSYAHWEKRSFEQAANRVLFRNGKALIGSFARDEFVRADELKEVCMGIYRNKEGEGANKDLPQYIDNSD